MHGVLGELKKIGNYIDGLEKENETLKSELENYKNNPSTSERENLKDYLIELMAPDIKKLESHKNVVTDRLGDIYRTYKRLFPDDSGGEKEHEQ